MLKFFVYVGVALACLIGLLGASAGWVLLSTPRPTNIKECLTTAMYQVHLCPTDKGYVKLNSVSLHARNAVIVSEDGSFYNHNGFDWSELKTSFETNLEKGEFARGGSTITQQLAKNVYLTKEKSILRKLREALITMQIEDLLKKDEILEKYLNVVEFGPNLYGIGKAARFYFQKSASELTPAEGAFLAFLLPNPKKYNVSFHKKQLTGFARSQVRKIVDRMFRFKKISEYDYQESLAQIDRMFGSAPAPELAPTADGSIPEELIPEEGEDVTMAPKFDAPPSDSSASTSAINEEQVSESAPSTSDTTSTDDGSEDAPVEDSI